VDIFTKKKRSEVMSRIKCTGTSPERWFYSLLRSALDRRFRIRKNLTAMPGRPDFLIPRLNLVIFVDGCFYHGCPKHGRIPKTNRSYWKPKLAKNRKRDLSNRRKLRRMGYFVWKFWEHDLKPMRLPQTRKTLENRLRKHMEAQV